MEKYKIVNMAVQRYHVDLSQVKDSAFAEVSQLLRGVLQKEHTESARKLTIERVLQNVYKSKNQSLGGCKRSEIITVIQRVFGIQSAAAQISKHLEGLSADELYMYLRYMERISKCEANTQNLLISEANKIHLIHMNQEAIRKENERQKHLSSMTEEERMKEDIMNGQDMEYYLKLEEFSGSMKSAMCKCLRESWIAQGKWEGSKISKKQEKKIKRIKELLEE